MAITSAGYFGTVSDAQWAQLFEPLPHWFRPGSYVPTAVASQRRVSLTAGVAFGAGVRDVSDAAITVDLTPPSSGGQWYLIVLRRVWFIGTSGTTSVQALTGPTTGGTAPTAPPTTAPATLQQSPSATDDAPVAWVHVRAADTTLTIFDARLMLTAVGGVVGGSAAARALLPLMVTLPLNTRLTDADTGITHRWNGTVWKPWDSDWLNYLAGVGGINGGFGESPGFVSTGSYRFVDGLVKFRGSFFLNGGSAAATSQITISLPVNASTATGARITGRIVGANHSTSPADQEWELNIGFNATAVYLGQAPDATGKYGGGAFGSIPFGEPWAQSDQVTWDLTYDPA